MFKKPLSQLKTSAPLRASDRRKLKQRVISKFNSSAEDGDLLVPEGIQVAKFSTYANELGTLYLDPSNGNPLWFTIGKGSEDLIPTICTLWKLPNSNLLPSVLIPSSVIPILVGGADLMIPGVITHTPSTLDSKQMVAIRQLTSTQSEDGTPNRVVSPPLSVGTMALSSGDLKMRKEKGEKGKAVLVLHTWKDHLWEMGIKGDVPPGVDLNSMNQVEEDERGDTQNEARGQDDQEQGGSEQPGPVAEETPATSETPAIPKISYTPQEISDLLTKSLIHAIATRLSSLAVSSFPISATQLYTTYILPSRPAFPTSVVHPSAATTLRDESTNKEKEQLDIDPVDITIKSSTHKSLTSFLKAAEKASLLTLKPAKQKSGSGDLLITSVNAQHPDVQSYSQGKRFVTIGEINTKNNKKTEREEQAEKERERMGKEVDLRELWKPHLASAELFEEMAASKSDLYTLNEVKTLLNAYITEKQLVNARNQAYINLDDALLARISAKKGKTGKAAPNSSPTDATVGSEFMKREELLKRVLEQMQSWYEVRVEGRDVVPRKGELKPIQVVTKARHSKRTLTLVTGFEPFLVIDAEEMAEELRKVCAGATSVSPVQGTGKPGLEVAVQGKQSKAVVDYLMEKGIPKKWIEVADAVAKK